MDEEIVDLGLRSQFMDEGLKTGFLRVDKDLEALDQRIDRRREECDKTREELCAAEGRIEVLEERSRSQREMIEALMARVENMEGQLCHCGKGKGCNVAEERVSLLGSPITLGRDIEEGSSSDDSYRTPPLAGSSIPPTSSSSGSSEEQALVLAPSVYDSCDSALIEIHEEIVANHHPVPIPSPCLDMAGIARLIAVRGQRAVHTLGRPKLSFHPYACCSIGERCSTHGPSRLCSRGDPSSGTPSSRGRNNNDEGSPASKSASRMGGDGGGADGGGQQRCVGLGWKQ